MNVDKPCSADQAVDVISLKQTETHSVRVNWSDYDSDSSTFSILGTKKSTRRPLQQGRSDQINCNNSDLENMMVRKLYLN